MVCNPLLEKLIETGRATRDGGGGFNLRSQELSQKVVLVAVITISFIFIIVCNYPEMCV